MTIIPNKVDEGSDPGGPYVAVCAGSRCAALWRLRDGTCAPDADAFTAAPLAALRRTVASTPGALLVRIGCVGACAAAPLVAVAHRPPDAAVTTEALWIAQSDAPARHTALIAWVEDDWLSGPPPAPTPLAGELLRMAPVGGEAPG